MAILARDNKGQHIAIVSHRVILKLLVLASLGQDSKGFWKIKQDTCCINVLEFKEQSGFVLARLNETCHLNPLIEACRQRDF